MKIMTTFNSFVRGSCAAVPGALLLVAFLAICRPGHAASIRLENGNSVAEFETQTALPFSGLQNWTVDGVDHMFHQWFWYRVGDAGPERTIDTLTHLESTPLDLNGDGLNEFLRTRYASPGLFTIQVNYLLNGASAGSNRSNLAEAIQIQNNSNLPLPLHFFQYADFDLNDSSNDDSLVITGTPRNTAHQTDPIMLVGETVTTQPPSHFEAGDVDALVSIEDRLNDALPTTLADVSGPLFSLDAAWAFQWDLLIPPGQSHLISKLKDIRPGPNIPEPGSLALVLGGLATMAIARRRWTRLG